LFDEWNFINFYHTSDIVRHTLNKHENGASPQRGLNLTGE
jgi:hypothetical protein